MMYSSCKWGSSLIIRCLVEYYKYPCLWDIENPDYKNKFKREKALEKMAFTMGIGDIEFIKKKIHSIRNSYINELKKIQERSTDGSDGYSSRLPWFKVADSFLSRVVHKRPSRNMIIKRENVEDESCAMLRYNELYNEKPDRPLAEKCVEQPVEERSSIASSAKEQFSRKRLSSSEEGPHFLFNKFRKFGNDPTQKLDQLFDVFGQSVAAQLKELPFKEALKIQLTIQTHLTESLLKCYEKKEDQNWDHYTEAYEDDYDCSTSSSSPKRLRVSSTSSYPMDHVMKMDVKLEKD